MITDAGGPPHVLQLLQTSRVLKCVPVMSHWQTVFMDASFTTPTRTISSFSQCLFWLNKSFISAPTVPSEEVQSLHVGLRIYSSTVAETLFLADHNITNIHKKITNITAQNMYAHHHVSNILITVHTLRILVFWDVSVRKLQLSQSLLF